MTNNAPPTKATTVADVPMEADTAIEADRPMEAMTVDASPCACNAPQTPTNAALTAKHESNAATKATFCPPPNSPYFNLGDVATTSIATKIITTSNSIANKITTLSNSIATKITTVPAMNDNAMTIAMKDDATTDMTNNGAMTNNTTTTAENDVADDDIIYNRTNTADVPMEAAPTTTANASAHYAEVTTIPAEYNHDRPTEANTPTEAKTAADDTPTEAATTDNDMADNDATAPAATTKCQP